MAIILAKYVPFKRKKLNRFIVGKILYVVCYISGSMCRKSNAVWSRLLILFYFFLFKDNRSLQLQKWCVLWAGSIAWYIEKKKVVILLAGCKHLCDRHCAQSLSADTGKKKRLLMFQQTLEVHVIALNFYDTWLCHIFMDKCNDGCP